MSVRTIAIIDCEMEHEADQVRTCLDWALPHAIAVRTHWGVKKHSGHVRGLNTGSKRSGAKAAAMAEMADRGWVFHSHAYPGSTSVFSFSGPGGLDVWVFPYHVEIHSACRWAGFLHITPLRRVHLNAFHRIASALKAKSMIIMPSDSRTKDLLWSGESFDDALASLEAEYGPPQPDVERIARLTRDDPPRTWFLEDVVDPK